MHINEQKRLDAVNRFLHFQFDLDENLQGILKLATEIYQAPVAFITLIDENSQYFKVCRGHDVQMMPRETSFCTHVIEGTDTVVISDACDDARFVGNPLVQQPPHIRFYAGTPLVTDDGNNIGTLCVMDNRVKEVEEGKKQLLGILAQQAINLMQLAVTTKLLTEKMEQVEIRNKVLMDIAFIQSHDFRGPLSTIMGLMNLIKEEEYQSPKEYLEMMDEAIAKLDDRIHLVVKSTEVIMSTYR